MAAGKQSTITDSNGQKTGTNGAETTATVPSSKPSDGGDRDPVARTTTEYLAGRAGPTTPRGGGRMTPQASAPQLNPEGMSPAPRTPRRSGRKKSRSLDTHTRNDFFYSPPVPNQPTVATSLMEGPNGEPPTFHSTPKRRDRRERMHRRSVSDMGSFVQHGGGRGGYTGRSVPTGLGQQQQPRHARPTYTHAHSERDISYYVSGARPLERVNSQEQLQAGLPSSARQMGRSRVVSEDNVGRNAVASAAAVSSANHRSALSGGGAYGSMLSRPRSVSLDVNNNKGQGTTPASPRGRNGNNHQQIPNEDFSPRRELLQLSNSFSSPSPRSVSMNGGGGTDGSGGVSASGYPPPPPPPPGLPGLDPTHPLHSFVTPPRAAKVPLIWEGPPGQGAGPNIPHYEPPSQAGDRTPLIKKQSSSRKRHMRINSAQLFMSAIKGEVQERKLRDVPFAILFYIQLGVVFWAAYRFGYSAVWAEPGRLEESDGLLSNTDDEAPIVQFRYGNFIKVAVACGLFACALSGLALVILTIFFRKVVQIALIASIVMSFAWGTIGIGLHPTSFVPITGIIALAFCIGYAFVVWDRIPFAAANLRTALQAVRCRLGIAVVAYIFQALALVWSILWCFAFTGVYDYVKTCGGDAGVPECPPDGMSTRRVNPGIYIGFAISYYWTLQVLTHVVQVTVAGAINHWWIKPEVERSFCPEPVLVTFVNAIVFNFGSICLGGLAVGFVQSTRQLFELFRPNRDAAPHLSFLNELLRPVQTCLFNCLDDLVSVYNAWAFTYIGLYGYSFREAGKNATNLLTMRGWTNLATDDLINNVLCIFSFMIGGCTGCFGMVMTQLDQYELASVSNPQVISFVIGFLIGLVLSSVLMGLVSSAVNAVIICFAESPAEFTRNHPELWKEMTSAWSSVWPGCLQGMPSQSERDLFHSLSLRQWDMA